MAIVSDSDPFEPAPLVIAVTAHRNLVDDEVPRIAAAIRQVFEQLSTQFPHTPITLLSPLAEGGGRLAAKVAIEMNLSLLIPLPLPAELYKADFEDSASIEEFDRLCEYGTVIELPLVSGNTRDSISIEGTDRDKQYAQLGIFLSSHCQILLAIWDGKRSDALGGTAQVVEYHLTDIMPGMTGVEATPQQLLGRDENDLVYHIVCSRDQPDGTPIEPLQALDTFILTSDIDQPRTKSLTASYKRIFTRLDEFNADTKSHWPNVSSHQFDLIDSNVVLQDRDKRVNSLFKAADWLASYYQTRVRAMFRSTYTLAVGMGLAFVAYADLPSQEYMIYVFLLLFGIGVAIYVVAQRGQWHRKYLDYRALAEGLRVQFYWQLAGVSAGTETLYAHDNFLQKQDLELGWIRNVMRASSIPYAPEPQSPVELDVAIQYWLKDNSTGQLDYYRINAAKRERLSTITSLVGMACLWAGIGAAIFLAFFHEQLTNAARDPLIVLMGVLPLIAAVREAYAHKNAEKELVKQYRFMERIFASAARQLDNATSDRDKRIILQALGAAALDEHAEWILMHRERPLEHGKL